MEQEKKIKQIFADILDVKEEAITDTFGPNDADMWDSINNLRLITALEEEFNIQLTMAEIREMDSFEKIKKVVGRHLPIEEEDGQSQGSARTAALGEGPPLSAVEASVNLAVFARRFLIPAPLVSLACFVKFGCLVHYRTEVEYSRHLKIGRNTFIAAFTKVKADRGPLVIGENVAIADGCHIESSEAGVTIGDDCLLGPHVTIIGVNYAHDRVDIPFRLQPGQSKGIAIGQNVWIGSGTCILDGSRIGNNVVITPNSVVSAKVPDNVIIQGNPAKVIFKRR